MLSFRVVLFVISPILYVDTYRGKSYASVGGVLTRSHHPPAHVGGVEWILTFEFGRRCNLGVPLAGIESRPSLSNKNCEVLEKRFSSEARSLMTVSTASTMDIKK